MKSKIKYSVLLRRYKCIILFLEVVFLKSVRGNTLLHYRKYTYYQYYKKKNGAKWKCSARVCKAFIVTNEYNEVISGSNNHPHEPPNYHITDNGEYIRL